MWFPGGENWSSMDRKPLRYDCSLWAFKWPQYHHMQCICDQNRSQGGVRKDTSKNSFRGGQENVWGTPTQRGNIAARMKSAGKVTEFPLLFQKQANQGPRDWMVYITLLGDLLPWPGLIPGRELRSFMLCHEDKKKKKWCCLLSSNWGFGPTLPLGSLSVPFVQQYLLTWCLCIIFW